MLEWIHRWWKHPIKISHQVVMKRELYYVKRDRVKAYHMINQW